MITQLITLIFRAQYSSIKNIPGEKETLQSNLISIAYDLDISHTLEY